MMKKLAILLLVVMLSVVACNSIDGTTNDDIQKAKDANPVDMHGK